jgi:hypothetical protein
MGAGEMERKKLLRALPVLAVLFLAPLLSGAGAGPGFMELSYGGPGVDVFNDVVGLGDDLVLVGTTSSFGRGMEDILVVRVDRYGNVKWALTLGGSMKDIGLGAAVTPSGEVVVVGTTWSFGGGGSNVLVSKISPRGKGSMAEFLLAPR